MSVLVTYGSKRGGTAGLAEMLGDRLRDEGLAAEVVAAREVRDVDAYDAVVIGGALYANRWHRDARRFVKRQTGHLRQRATYLFSSGPLDDSATQREIPPVKGVQTLIERVGARGHMTFGGRLSPDAKGFPAKAMAKKRSGDWRDHDHVRTWARQLASELRAEVTQGG